MILRMMSLELTPGASVPVTWIFRTLTRLMARVWVARMSRICVVPTPKASAPSAPCVEVCESPQAMVMPGWVRPSSGPMTWTMPCSSVSRPKKRMPNSLVFFSSSPHHRLGQLVAEGPRTVVGRHDVVHRGEGALGVQHLEAALAQHLEGLRRGDLVDEVQADEELILARRQGGDLVQVPHLVQKVLPISER